MNEVYGAQPHAAVAPQRLKSVVQKWAPQSRAAREAFGNDPILEKNLHQATDQFAHVQLIYQRHDVSQ